jgi:hypothetical protein
VLKLSIFKGYETYEAAAKKFHLRNLLVVSAKFFLIISPQKNKVRIKN